MFRDGLDGLNYAEYFSPIHSFKLTLKIQLIAKSIEINFF